MAGVNIGNQGLTQIDYLSKVAETLNHSSMARTLPAKHKWTGEHIEGRAHVGRNSSIAYMEDGGAFGAAGKQTYVTYKATRKFISGAIQITDGAMATAGSNKNTFRNVIQSETKGLMRDMLKNEELHFFLDGTGTVTTLIGADITAAATDVPVADGRGLWDDSSYEIRDATTPTTTHGTVTVDNVEAALNSSNQALVNFSATVAGAGAGDLVVRKGSYARALTGLDKLIGNSGTFQTVVTGTYPSYTSSVLSASANRPLTPTLFRQMLASIKQKSGKDRPAKGLTVLTNNWQAIEVEELYEGELRLTPESKTGGAAVAAFNSAFGRIEVRTASLAPLNKMFFCDFSQIKRAVQKPLSWRRQGGKIFMRNDAAAVWTATALEVCDLFINERHTCGKISELAETPLNPFG
jgi:hypothetical protein